MKKVIVSAVIAGCMLSVSAMASCLVDQDVIQSQIAQYGSITTNGYQDYYPTQISEIDSATPDNQDPSVCIAYGNYGSYLLGWMDGDWGNTILAAPLYSKKTTQSVTDSFAQSVKVFGATATQHKKK
ncbi:MAG: hypothetical protein ACD_45C00470G0001 [uncultured bacterium]|nr:MAG: hypothetical protein ACD_45C00470G0001 [uncultured bacterium]OGT26106.1 MAG: hypothetical protein A3B71_04415 [Gammaproteobacteria bacterium RIFCSPHIGHO2_02_FULL_42_43]OGT29269.1 MAG: hypothetical protein A2624_07335 [Gammaproteobacteria bacterium RIFCSPHIGHO2_01_FULL_42_8]OGT50872.1 MAG: hypothetical protein A3E54_03815 [Gammaproteobacteria bacterium RIFCSPHIGHO2_12_FULL_41_25]OGT62533.1 MAG: hypothetical protein A3I77_01805 [Gammaproteobacteria bacterium RIFCSPLOWO2_02_FULL_42_14]OGT